MARRRLTGTYIEPATGAAQAGAVVFAPVPSPWFNTNTDEVITGVTRVELNDGSFAVDLTPTDEPGVNPATGRLWRMTELIPGALPRTVRFQLPAGDTPIDVTDLVPVED